MVKTVESALQVNIFSICKAARQSHSSAVVLEWDHPSGKQTAVAIITEGGLIVAIRGEVLHTSLSRREFRKDRFLPYIHCLACAKRCHILFVENGSLQCRKCAGLIYECQRGRARQRLTVKVQKLMSRLGACDGVIPSRRVGMWRKTYRRRLRELADAIQALART